jgi:hypothetical protein
MRPSQLPTERESVGLKKDIAQNVGSWAESHRIQLRDPAHRPIERINTTRNEVHAVTERAGVRLQHDAGIDG